MTKSVLTPITERFWSKVKKIIPYGCWEWTGGKTAAGYGMLGSGRRGEKNIYAHRLSYELHCGYIADAMLVCHWCNNPGCVNPAHLYEGTKSDNGKQAYADGLR